MQGISRKIEMLIENAQKQLLEFDDGMTDAQKWQAGEEQRAEALKKAMEADAQKAPAEPDYAAEADKASASSLPEMGDGNPFDDIE